MRASDIRKGQAVIIDGKLMVVTGADHNTPGNLRAKVQFKLRDVIKQTIMDKRVSATEDIETATLDRRKAVAARSGNLLAAKARDVEDLLAPGRYGWVIRFAHARGRGLARLGAS